METKRCTKCKQVKPTSEFGHHSQTKSGISSQCLQCKREQSARFRKTPEGIYQQIKGRTTFYKKNYNIRYKPVTITRNDFVEWYRTQPKNCIYCGLPEEKIKKVHGGHLDRVLRLTIDCIDNDLGYAKGNLVLACNRCNLIKSNVFTYEEMLEIGEKYLKPKWQHKL